MGGWAWDRVSLWGLWTTSGGVLQMVGEDKAGQFSLGAGQQAGWWRGQACEGDLAWLALE